MYECSRVRARVSVYNVPKIYRCKTFGSYVVEILNWVACHCYLNLLLDLSICLFVYFPLYTLVFHFGGVLLFVFFLLLLFLIIYLANDNCISAIVMLLFFNLLFIAVFRPSNLYPKFSTDVLDNCSQQNK